MKGSRFDIVLDRTAAYPIINARGELDQVALESLQASFREAAELDRGIVVLSLLDSTYFDSLTVHAIMGFHARLESNRQRLIICVPEHGTPRRILEISGVAQRVATFSNIVDALAAAPTISLREKSP